MTTKTICEVCGKEIVDIWVMMSIFFPFSGDVCGNCREKFKKWAKENKVVK